MRTLLLVPPLIDAASRYGGPGGLGALDFPAALAQAAAVVGNSKLIDAPADELKSSQVILLARGFELCAVSADLPNLQAALAVAAGLKGAYPRMMLGLVGVSDSALQERALAPAAPFDFACGHDFDQILRETANSRPFPEIRGIAYKSDGEITRTPCRNGADSDREIASVLEVYRRDLTLDHYQLPYLRFPHLTLPTAAGARRLRPEAVVADVQRALSVYPQLQEIFLDDDSITASADRAESIARGLSTTGISWSCRAAANTPPQLLKKLKERGLRLLVLDCASRTIEPSLMSAFAHHCRALGIRVHGRFLLGGPGATRQTLRQTIRHACALDLDSIHVDAQRPTEHADIDDEDVRRGLFRLYARFYLRPRAFWRAVQAIWRHPRQRARRLHIGRQFLRFLWNGLEVAG
ncbi:MAG: hypothetical protein ABIJ96_12475 [Elusimicrobiota bacterium]